MINTEELDALYELRSVEELRSDSLPNLSLKTRNIDEQCTEIALVSLVFRHRVETVVLGMVPL